MPPPEATATTDRRRSSLSAHARDIVNSSIGVIADQDGNHYDPVGSTEGNQRTSFLQEVKENVERKFGSVTGEKALNPNAVAELEKTNPGVLGFLTSMSGAVLEIAIFITYVGLDMGKGLFNSGVLKGSFREKHTLISSSLIMTQGIVQLTLGLITTVALEGTAGLKRLANPTRFRNFFLVSLLFALAQNFGTLAYTVFSPGTIKILGQCRLLNTAVLSRFIFSRKYLEIQWLLMSIIIIGAVLHLVAKTQNESIYQDMELLQKYGNERLLCQEHLSLGLNASFNINVEEQRLVPMVSDCVIVPPKGDDDDDGFVLGLFYVFSYIMCSDIASIVSEMYLKAEKDTPFYIQKVTMESMGVPILFITSFITPWVQMIWGVDGSRWAPQMWWAGGILGGFMGGNDALEFCANNSIHHGPGPWIGGCGAAAGGLWRDWGVSFAPYGALFFSSAQSWFAGILVKLMSSVVKLLAKIVSLGGVYFIGDCGILRPDEGNSAGATVSALQVILLTYTFLTIPVPKEDVPKPAS